MDEIANNYVVGRGRLFFGQFAAGTRKARGQRYFGNTPALSLSQSEDKLDHYSSEGGIRIKDASITLQNDSAGSFQCDNIDDANLALWFGGVVAQHVEAGSGSAQGTVTFAGGNAADGDTVTIGGQAITFKAANPVGMQVLIGNTLAATAAALAAFLTNTPALGVTATSAGAVTTLTAIAAGADGNDVTLAKAGANIAVSGAKLAGGTDVTETLHNVERGLWLQLGVTPATPWGVRNVSSVSIANVADASYLVENETGRIYLSADAQDIADGADLEVSYGIAAASLDVVIAKGMAIEGELQFLANNAAGLNKDYFWPYARLTPDGDFSLKGDEWQAITFNLEILKRDAVTERQYITTRPATGG